LNDPAKVAIALETIGYAFEQRDHFSQAREKYQEALRLFKQYSDQGDMNIRHANGNTFIRILECGLTPLFLKVMLATDRNRFGCHNLFPSIFLLNRWMKSYLSPDIASRDDILII
jgi:hypothetical protein